MSKGSVSSSIVNNSTWSSCSSDTDTSTSILAKLRRLRIQEGLLLQNVHKIMFKNYDNGEDYTTPCSSSEYKSYISNLKNSYSEIKNVFESVKCNTTSHEALKTHDIDDIKNDVLELETKLKKFKNYLISEQTSLKAKELELIKQMSTKTGVSETTTKQPKVKTKPFSEIVPSPVKNIISSPFKCQEVQQFQEFSKSYQRYGGWNEYSHNMFTQTWLKHFQSTSDLNFDICGIVDSSGFINEVIDKIPGITKEDIIQHSKWYLEYLHLKRRQQEALNKWRAKKQIIKKSQVREKVENGIIKKADYQEETYRKCTKRVNDIVSDEMKRIEEIFSIDLFDDPILSSSSNNSNESYIRHSKSAAVGKEKGQKSVEKFLTRPNSTQEFDSKIKKRRGLLHFAKSTQQWTNMCNEKKNQIGSLKYVPQLEEIGKLCIPTWRMHIQYT